MRVRRLAASSSPFLSSAARIVLLPLLLAVASSAPALLPGDANGDGMIGAGDGEAIIAQLLGMGNAPGRPDANGDAAVNIGDAVGLVNVVALNGAGFNVREYLLFPANSTWSYIDVPSQPGDSDGFDWTVQASTIGVAGARQATRVRTDTEEPSDDRNESEDFWFVDPNGDVLFCGFHQGQETSVLEVQDIILNEPLTIGRDGQMIGDVLNDSAMATVQTALGAVTGTVNSTVTYTSFLAAKPTPLGTFSPCLRMTLALTVSATVPIIGPVTLTIQDSVFYLRRNVGMVSIDQAPDENDAELEELDGGTVGGVAITPDA